MSLNKKITGKSSSFLIPEDSHIATLYSIVDIGDQETGFRKTDKDGNDAGVQISSQVMLTFELQDVHIEDGRPAAISNTLTASVNEKARLRPILLALLGGTSEAKALFESEEETVGSLLKRALGKSVLLSIVHRESKGKVYANIAGAVPLPSSMKGSLKEPHNKLVFVDDVNNISSEMEALIPDWVFQKKINQRLNGKDSIIPF